MKVFISWSGERSNKIAEVLKQWIRHVIQSVEPFVSSQDISKGARWSTDIAKELQDTNFGILCVTKDNFQQPWLLFEAGALSKTIEKSYVVPLLFDLEPSDLQDSPLLQFQATSFSKEEIKKLIVTLNTACGPSALDSHELDEAFSVWYPKLEESLSKIEPEKAVPSEKGKPKDVEKTLQILEEILELTRMNQKLIRNPDNKVLERIELIVARMETMAFTTARWELPEFRGRALSPTKINEMLHMSSEVLDSKDAFLLVLSFYKNTYPGIYELGKDMIDTINSNVPNSEKANAILNFRKKLDNFSTVLQINNPLDSKNEMSRTLQEISRLTGELLEGTFTSKL